MSSEQRIETLEQRLGFLSELVALNNQFTHQLSLLLLSSANFSNTALLTFDEKIAELLSQYDELIQNHSSDATIQQYAHSQQQNLQWLHQLLLDGKKHHHL